MPILSAAANLPYAPDPAFRPVTTLMDNAVPDYWMHFLVGPDYLAKDFAWDAYGNASDLIDEAIVDRNFLICRYERLFLHPNRSNYYCVPWMGIPGTKAGSVFTPFKPSFVLKITKPISLKSLPTDNRKLELRPTSGITATWGANRSVTSQKNIWLIDFALFKGDEIDLTISPNNYGEAGGAVEVWDLKDNKRIGKLRILFLENLVVDAFPLIVEETNTLFRLRRLQPAEIPTSIESLGPAAAQGKITDDANTYGFAQMGIQIDFDASANQVFDEKGNAFPLTSADPVEITKQFLALGSSSIDSEDKYEPLINSFIRDISYLDETVTQGPNTTTIEVSKFATIFILITQFKIVKLSSCTTGITLIYNKIDDDRILTNPLTVGLFESIKDFVVCWPVWTASATFGPTHQFETLVHEIGHALLLGHFFPNELKDSSGKVISPHADICSAHKWLRFYLKGENISNSEMYTLFNDKKITIQDLIVGKNADGRNITIFDKIIEDGIGKAIDDYIDTKLFPSGRPASWGGQALAKFDLGEMIIWKALNDLVKYKRDNTIPNTMDYDGGAFELKPPSGSGSQELYVKQTALRFNRFQWEVLRRSAMQRRRIAALL